MTSMVDYDQKCREELLLLQQQDHNISNIKSEISRLKLTKKVPYKEKVTFTKSSIVTNEEKEEDSFEDEIGFYLVSYRHLRENFSEEEIKVALPNKKNPKYKDILLRLSLESVKEIKEIKEIIRNEELSEEEIDLCNKTIEKESKKINYIKSKLIVEEKEAEVEEEKNNIVLIPTLYGNIRIIDDLEHIPSEYYAGFKGLIDSIIDGTFKNVKVLANNSELAGVTEVKDFKIRVIFMRLNNNTYGLVTAFVKKFDTDKLNQESLAGKIREYHSMESKLKEKLNDPEFLEENEKNVQQLWNILSPENNKRKEK